MVQQQQHLADDRQQHPGNKQQRRQLKEQQHLSGAQPSVDLNGEESNLSYQLQRQQQQLVVCLASPTAAADLTVSVAALKCYCLVKGYPLVCS
jgi:hypothetical protein